MKPTIVLFVSMLSMPAMAQRDFLLTKQRNVWLTSANAAALTTFSDSTIAHATLSYSHADGTRRSLSDGKRPCFSWQAQAPWHRSLLSRQ